MTEPREYNRVRAVARLVAVFALLLALLGFARPTVASVTVGLVLVSVGEGIRLWSAGHLHKTVELVTSGPYRYTRNPLYLGRLLILSGFCVAATLPFRANLAALALGWAIFFAYYLPRKERVEPARLEAIHGARYASYRAAVPALFPRLTAWPEGGHGTWSWTKLLRNREHWMVVGLTAAFVFLALRSGGTS